MSELLTESEKELVKLLGDCYNLYTKVCGNETKVRVYDLQEFALHIHNCQNAVLAQAAARSYPEHYRLAGESFKDMDELSKEIELMDEPLK